MRGPTGEQGLGIRDVSYTGGNLRFIRSDNSMLGPYNIVGPAGIGIKNATVNTAGNLLLTKTDDGTFGPWNISGPQGGTGPTGPKGDKGDKGDPGTSGSSGNIQSAENVTWVQGRTMWCADGTCIVPSGKVKFSLNDGDKIQLTSVDNGSKISHLSGWGVGVYAGQPTANTGFVSFQTGTPTGYVERVQINADGLTVNGASRLNGPIVVQGAIDGGATRGIRMWDRNNDAWGIYMSTAGDGKALNGGATQGVGGITSHAMRFRVNNAATNGVIFENSANTALMGINGSTGDVTMNGKLTLPSNKRWQIGDWEIDATDGHLRFKHLGVQVFGPNGSHTTAWKYTARVRKTFGQDNLTS